MKKITVFVFCLIILPLISLAQSERSNDSKDLKPTIIYIGKSDGLIEGLGSLWQLREEKKINLIVFYTDTTLTQCAIYPERDGDYLRCRNQDQTANIKLRFKRRPNLSRLATDLNNGKVSIVALNDYHLGPKGIDNFIKNIDYGYLFDFLYDLDKDLWRIDNQARENAKVFGKIIIGGAPSLNEMDSNKLSQPTNIEGYNTDSFISGSRRRANTQIRAVFEYLLTNPADKEKLVKQLAAVRGNLIAILERCRSKRRYTIGGRLLISQEDLKLLNNYWEQLNFVIPNPKKEKNLWREPAPVTPEISQPSPVATLQDEVYRFIENQFRLYPNVQGVKNLKVDFDEENNQMLLIKGEVVFNPPSRISYTFGFQANVNDKDIFVHLAKSIESYMQGKMKNKTAP